MLVPLLVILFRRVIRWAALRAPDKAEWEWLREWEDCRAAAAKDEGEPEGMD